MAEPTRQRKPDELIDKAAERLARGEFFEAERLAESALGQCHQNRQFAPMPKVIAALWDARRSRMRAALDAGKLTVMNEQFEENIKLKPGVYLVQPPLVGSDARRLRLAALMSEVPVIVLCREPLTRTGHVPIVAISPGTTLRTKVSAPKNPDKPDIEWFTAAIEELGESAIDDIDPELALPRRIESLVCALDALPEHENLHLALKAACESAIALGEPTDAPPPKSAQKSKMAT